MTKILYLLSFQAGSDVAFERWDEDTFEPRVGTRVSFTSGLANDGVIASSFYSVVSHRWEALIIADRRRDDADLRRQLKEEGWVDISYPYDNETPANGGS